MDICLSTLIVNKLLIIIVTNTAVLLLRYGFFQFVKQGRRQRGHGDISPKKYFLPPPLPYRKNVLKLAQVDNYSIFFLHFCPTENCSCSQVAPPPQNNNNRQVEQKPGGRGREYNNLPFKMHCDSIIMRSCWIGD